MEKITKLFNELLEKRRKRKRSLKRRKYMLKHGVNLKCPCCKVWSSEADEVNGPNLVNIGYCDVLRYECANCKGGSYWVVEAGFFLGSDEIKLDLASCEQAYQKFKHANETSS